MNDVVLVVAGSPSLSLRMRRLVDQFELAGQEVVILQADQDHELLRGHPIDPTVVFDELPRFDADLFFRAWDQVLKPHRQPKPRRMAPPDQPVALRVPQLRSRLIDRKPKRRCQPLPGCR